MRQGTAGPYQFRTAPLWGLGQRLFSFTMAALPTIQAIQSHSSSGSEANVVIRKIQRAQRVGYAGPSEFPALIVNGV